MSEETPAERREAAATRRRWVTLAEVVALAGVVIAGLTLYTNWADRRADETTRVATETSEARDKARVELTAKVGDGGRTLTLSDARHDITDAVFAFPRAIGVVTQHPAGEPIINASWFDTALLKLTDGGSDEKTGRLPVLVSVSYLDGDTPRTSNGLYDIVWRTEGRFLGGRKLLLENLKLRQRGAGQAALDAAWAREKPTPHGS